MATRRPLASQRASFSPRVPKLTMLMKSAPSVPGSVDSDAEPADGVAFGGGQFGVGGEATDEGELVHDDVPSVSWGARVGLSGAAKAPGRQSGRSRTPEVSEEIAGDLGVGEFVAGDAAAAGAVVHLDIALETDDFSQVPTARRRGRGRRSRPTT